MPGPLTSSRRHARRGWGVAIVALALGPVLALVGCTNGPDAVPPGSTSGAPTVSVTASAGASPATAGATGAARAAVTDLLRRRAAAVVAGDEHGYAGTVADASTASGRRQLDAFAAARALRVSRLQVGEPTVELVATDPVAATSSTSSPSAAAGLGGAALRARAEVDLAYRVDDLDRGDRVARVEYDLVRTGDAWKVESERPVGPGATAPWVAMPGLRVVRGDDVVVAGTVPAGRLAEHVAVVDRGLPGLARYWAGTPDRVLVLAPATAAEADALLGRASGDDGSPVAATTEGPTGSAGTATGDRVVLDPTAFGRLTATGRDVVLTHELAHVAVRATVPGRPAAWLAEGYADHVGYARADVPAGRLLAPLVTAMRTGQGPRSLPTAAQLQPAGGDIEVPYLAAWQAVELIADEHGEAALRRLVVAASRTGSDTEVEAATDRALVSVLHATRAELTDAWLTRLGRIVTAG